MITKLKHRYYCEYCGKSGGSKHHMKNHESSCTRNPNRKCRMCEYALQDGASSEELTKNNVSKMVNIINNSMAQSYFDDYEVDIFKVGFTEQSVIQELMSITACPACILSAMVTAKKTSMFPSFDYKTQKRDMFIKYSRENMP